MCYTNFIFTYFLTKYFDHILFHHQVLSNAPHFPTNQIYFLNREKTVCRCGVMPQVLTFEQLVKALYLSWGKEEINFQAIVEAIIAEPRRHSLYHTQENLDFQK